MARPKKIPTRTLAALKDNDYRKEVESLERQLADKERELSIANHNYQALAEDHERLDTKLTAAEVVVEIIKERHKICGRECVWGNRFYNMQSECDAVKKWRKLQSGNDE